MPRGYRFALGVAFALAIPASEVQAQYYPGYGGYGWGGWGGGGGATVQGDIARGLGFYNIGAGEYNLKTAEADSINVDTVTRWNQYLWLSQQEANRREYLRMAQRQKMNQAATDSIYRRLRDNPTPSDVHNGDALNVVLDQLTDPRIHSSALRTANDAVSSDIIDDIPFENGSEAVALSLNELTGKTAWPNALQTDQYAQDRDDWAKALEQALAENDRDERISGKTLSTIRGIATRIKNKLESNLPEDPTDRGEARNYVKTMLGLSRMLGNPRVDKALAALEHHPKTTLGGLLGFMQTYNLRFGPAKTPEQRGIYDDLFGKLTAQRDRVLKETGIDDAGAPVKASGHPTDFFQGMKTEHLEDKTPANN
ncbi:hypothetical protein [Singulisphaera sp. PoT]|uniref:hypothetical protein n=1 Tax=Singulisphaera sp. PoT TaxID=3411797 RepID=UPI003BF61BD6